MQPDYSRQILLKEIGLQGQAKLSLARVLIVGLGGLGSPVMQYLAAAGVGFLGLIDADVLDASNLHRQPIYALADVGKQKADLARAAIAAINPAVQVETHAANFDADNALELVRRHDIVVDCSDNFRAKYLINDAAAPCKKPPPFSPACISTRASSRFTNRSRRMPACAVFGRMRSPTAWSAIVRKRASSAQSRVYSARCRRC